jgi:uncharacterized protein (TIGR00369 family)
VSATLDPSQLGAVEKMIVSGPYSDLLGIRSEEILEDRVRLVLPFRPELTTVGEMVHGGAIASLVDVAATAAAWATPRATLQARGSTIGFSINYLKPGLGCDLHCEARVIQRGRAVCVVDVSVANAAAGVVARAMVTYRLSLPPDDDGGSR